MLIKRLKMVGNVRLLCNNIMEFEITPNEMVQLIIGSNGSGKTSLVREMTPLPAAPADYVTGGYKIIELIHGGKEYVLESNFAAGSKHTFTVNGENLNTGRTATVQKELVWQHFQFDQALFDVLMDEDLFTHMSPNTLRREWLMRMSGSNFDYAMSIFQKLKTRHRDVVGHHKQLSARLAKEIERLPKDEEIERLKTLSKECLDDIEVLMDNRDPTAPQRAFTENRVNSLLNELGRTAEEILNVGFNRWKDVNSTEDLTNILQQRLDILAKARGNHEAAQSEYSRLAALQQSLSSNNVSSVSELDGQMKSLMEEKRKLLLTVGDSVREISDASKVKVILSTILDDLREIFSEMPPNRDNKHSEEQRSVVASRDKELRERHKSLNNLLIKNQHRIAHIEKADTHSCPKCGFNSKIGVNENEIPDITNSIAAIESEMREIEKELGELSDYLEENALFRSYIRRLNQHVNTHKELQPLWKSVADAWVKGANPRAALPILVSFVNELSTLALVEEIDNRINEARRIKTELELAGEDSGSRIGDMLHSINKEIHECVNTIESQYRDVKALEGLKRSFQTINDKHQQLEKIFLSIQSETELLIRAIRNETINEVLRERQTALAQVETALKAALSATSIIEDLQRERDKALATMEVLEILVSELSPVDGLIADQVKGFVGDFVEQMNSIIGRIWTSDFKLLPCESEEDELTYKFPFVVKGQDRVIPDVKAGSRAQKEMVNLAFKLVVCFYLGLDEYPMYLDEPATTFDEQHRFNIVAFLKEYVETRHCSQLFYISHYAQQHGAFQGAEICVLDTTNIVTMPEVYNRHVRLH